ncbi:POLQ [Cordylochernes scorpioides]|uniref:POLQ n=1 Tax=Cordylochernes scorpioides TaxID=51811 RepID=A0ABY6KNG5_9ARAC|nr:POLQ [Cordylochernes scorpioides]
MTKLTGRWRYQKRSQPWKHPQANMELPPPEDPPEEECSSQVKLTDWGLPPEVVEGYRAKGLVTMFPWQAECLLQGRALAGGNLVYSAPTSAGKTLVAEILVLKCVLERPGKKALFILPFVSLAREKMLHFQGMFGDSGVRVDGYMGSHHPPGGLAALDIAVCTIEKANGLVNHMLEDSGNLEDLGILVVDELHLVGDSHRGYLLELLLTKVLFANLQRSEEERTQIVGMSATLPNLTTLAGWLRADLYTTDFRPVPLRELVKVGPELLEGGQLLRRLDHCPLQFPADPDHTIQLALEPLLAGGHGVLVFCPTKNWCEQLAQNLAREIYRLGSLSVHVVQAMIIMKPHNRVAPLPSNHVCPANSTSSELTAGRRLREVLNSDRLAEILELLRKTPAGLDEILVRTVAFGVAFHHAGLTMEERDVLEAGFRAGHLKLLVATSTLSSGVNLPARRVLIRSPHFRGNSLDPLAYRQMAGRAGRKGADTQGESILLCKENEKAAAEALIGAEMQPVQSCLLQTNGDLSSSLKRAILEVVASGVAKQPQDVRQYMSCTLLACAVSAEQDEVTAAVDGCIGFLQEQELITITGEDFHPTKLGLAVLASSLSPDEGLRVFTELQKARQCFVLDSDLHLIYQVCWPADSSFVMLKFTMVLQVTPPYISDMLEQIDWLHYMNLWEKLPAGQRRVGELVGVEERFLARCVRGQNPTGPRQKRLLGIHRRFFAALALADLVSEVPLHEVASKFSCGRGLLQSLQQSAATFAGLNHHCVKAVTYFYPP